jgi:DNA-binding CsgD family transcriptional regulator
MKVMMRILISIFAIIFLFGIHSKLLWILNPDKINHPTAIIDTQTGQSHIEYHPETFSFIRFQDENNSSAMVAAIIFSIITVFILNLFDPKDWFFWVAFPVFAITDGIGTILYLFPDIDKLQLFSFILADGKLNNIPNTKLIGAFYYGIYVIIFLASVAMLRFKYRGNKNYSNNISQKKVWNKPVVKFRITDERIIELKNQGLKQKEIADQLKISQGTVSKALKKIGNSDKI